MVDAVSNNQNNHPNAGKLVGAGLGVATSGYFIHKNVKTAKIYKDIADSDVFKKAVNEKNIEGLTKIFNDSKLGYSQKISGKFLAKNDVKVLSYAVNKATKVSKGQLGFMTVLTVGFMAGIGAIVDHFRNN